MLSIEQVSQSVSKYFLVRYTVEGSNDPEFLHKVVLTKEQTIQFMNDEEYTTESKYGIVHLIFAFAKEYKSDDIEREEINNNLFFNLIEIIKNSNKDDEDDEAEDEEDNEEEDDEDYEEICKYTGEKFEEDEEQEKYNIAIITFCNKRDEEEHVEEKIIVLTDKQIKRFEEEERQVYIGEYKKTFMLTVYYKVTSPKEDSIDKELPYCDYIELLLEKTNTGEDIKPLLKFLNSKPEEE